MNRYVYILVRYISIFKMAVLKRNKSGRSLLFVDDTGRTYITSVEHVNRLLDGKFKSEFIVLTRLPGLVAANRFPASPLWDPSTGTTVPLVDGVIDIFDDHTLTTSNDALSRKAVAKVDVYKDVML